MSSCRSILFLPDSTFFIPAKWRVLIDLYITELLLKIAYLFKILFCLHFAASSFISMCRYSLLLGVDKSACVLIPDFQSLYVHDGVGWLSDQSCGGPLVPFHSTLIYFCFSVYHRKDLWKAAFFNSFRMFIPGICSRCFSYLFNFLLLTPFL